MECVLKTDHPRDILRVLEQRARRRFGQHFLVRTDVVETMVRRARVQAGDKVLEVGPGLGILTAELLRAGADLTCVELDRDLAGYIGGRFPQARLIEGDALHQRWRELITEGPVSVVANLPYNVGTRLVMDLLELPDLFKSITVMLQKEVVDRMLAGPGCRTYGALSVRVQARCQPVFLMAVEPNSFYPPPKVQSSVIRLLPYAEPKAGACGVKAFDRVVRASFSQRRKKLSNSLGALVGKELARSAIDAVGLDSGVRAEHLSLEEFRALTEMLEELGSASVPSEDDGEAGSEGPGQTS